MCTSHLEGFEEIVKGLYLGRASRVASSIFFRFVRGCCVHFREKKKSFIFNVFSLASQAQTGAHLHPKQTALSNSNLVTLVVEKYNVFSLRHFYTKYFYFRTRNVGPTEGFLLVSLSFAQ